MPEGETVPSRRMPLIAGFGALVLVFVVVAVLRETWVVSEESSRGSSVASTSIFGGETIESPAFVESVTTPESTPVITFVTSPPMDHLTVVDAHALHMNSRGMDDAVAQIMRYRKNWRYDAHVPGLRDAHGSVWSVLCQYLVPVEAGTVRNGTIWGVSELEERALSSVRSRVLEAGEKYLRVHTDVCVGLAGAIGIEEYRLWNPGNDGTCSQCRLGGLVLGDSWSEWEEKVEGVGHVEAHAVIAGSGERSRLVAEQIRREWVGVLDREEMVNVSLALESWIARGDEAFANESVRMQMEGYGERVVVLWDDEIGGKSDVLDRVLSLASRRHCADLLFLRAESLLETRNVRAKVLKFKKIGRGTLLPERLQTGSSSAPLQALVDFLEPVANFSEVLSLTIPEYPVLETWATLLPEAAFVRSRCRPQPGAGTLCRTRSYVGIPRQKSEHRWDGKRPEMPSFAPEDRPPLRFIHMHKGGGTTMCNMALRERERVTGPDDNCNSKLVLWCGQPLHLHACDILADMAVRSKTFGATEHAIEQPLCDSIAMYSTILRDPIDLTSSALLFHKYTTSIKIKHLLDHEPVTDIWPRDISYIQKPRKHNCNTSAPYISQYADNFQTRILLGNPGRIVPTGNLSIVHLERAKYILRRLCVLGIVGSLSYDTPPMANALGWSQKYTATHARGSKSKASSKACLSFVAKKYHNIFYDGVQIDNALLEYARTIKPRVGAPESTCHGPIQDIEDT